MKISIPVPVGLYRKVSKAAVTAQESKATWVRRTLAEAAQGQAGVARKPPVNAMQFTVPVPADLVATIAEAARKAEVSKAAWMRRALREAAGV